MHNFVALAEENQWLQELDVEIVNARLGERRRIHDRLVASGEFWSLSKVCAEGLLQALRLYVDRHIHAYPPTHLPTHPLFFSSSTEAWPFLRGCSPMGPRTHYPHSPPSLPGLSFFFAEANSLFRGCKPLDERARAPALNSLPRTRRRRAKAYYTQRTRLSRLFVLSAKLTRPLLSLPPR